MTTKGDNTPTNTLREQIEDIIVDTTMHPVEQSLKIESLISEAVNKARIEEELDTLNWVLVQLSFSDPERDEKYITDRIAELETPNQVEGK